MISIYSQTPLLVLCHLHVCIDIYTCKCANERLIKLALSYKKEFFVSVAGTFNLNDKTKFSNINYKLTYMCITIFLIMRASKAAKRINKMIMKFTGIKANLRQQKNIILFKMPRKIIPSENIKMKCKHWLD